MAAKVAGALRLLPEKWARVDAYAKARNVSRQRVLESAVDSFLADAVGGVPDLAAEEPLEVVRQTVNQQVALQREKNMRLAREMGWAP